MLVLSFLYKLLLIIIYYYFFVLKIDIIDLQTRTFIKRSLAVPNSHKDTGLCMALRFFRNLHISSVGVKGNNSPSSEILLAAGYENGSIVIWDVESGVLLSRAKVHNEPCKCLIYIFIVIFNICVTILKCYAWMFHRTLNI